MLLPAITLTQLLLYFPSLQVEVEEEFLTNTLQKKLEKVRAADACALVPPLPANCPHVLSTASPY
jgi:hypothetical protein